MIQFKQYTPKSSVKYDVLDPLTYKDIGHSLNSTTLQIYALNTSSIVHFSEPTYSDSGREGQIGACSGDQ